MHAVILSIGDELVLGQTVDTNSAFLSAELATLGIGTLYHQTVADDQLTIATAIRQASSSAQLVLISGGLGPTDDDLTRQALAEAMSVDLVRDEASIEAIKAMFDRIGRPMSKRNEIQAMHPRSSQMISNDCGTAPGICAELNGAVIYVAPGVPHELFAMFEKSILPQLQQYKASRHVILTAKVNTFGLGESHVAQKLEGLTDRDRNPLVGTTVSEGIVAVRVRSEFADRATTQQQLDRTIEQVQQRLGAAVFGREDETIQQSLVEMLRERGMKVATAESCTGGLLGEMITQVSGSSDVYIGGWVTYSNEMKEALGVAAALIERHGVVSQPVVESMASCAALRCGADAALAITGVAGPQGGSVDKPVGTVWVGLACRNAGEQAEYKTESLLLKLTGNRRAIRDRAAKSAVQMLRLRLRGEPVEELSFGRHMSDVTGDK